MFLIGAFLILLVASLVAAPLIRKIPYRAGRVGAWVTLIGALTWPVLLGPAIFKLQCAAFTEVNLGSGIDARRTGYLDHRLSVPELIRTNLAGSILNRDLDDLANGRVSFIEQIIPGSRPVLYARYALFDLNSEKCAPKSVAETNGKSALLAQIVPGKCLGVEHTTMAKSVYEVSMDGDFNRGIGVSRLVKRSSGESVATLRTYGFSFLYSGTEVCPRLKVVGDEYSPHTAFTTLVLLDALSNVRSAVSVR